MGRIPGDGNKMDFKFIQKGRGSAKQSSITFMESNH